MTSLPAGTVGNITGLQSASHLNGKQAFIIDPPAKDAERHSAFIVSSASSPSSTAHRFVRLKLSNFRVTSMLTPSHETSRYKSPPLSKYPFTARPLDAVEAVFDSRSDKLPSCKYFSVWPPTYLFASTWKQKKQSYSSLQLASVDLSHSLYSLYHLDEKDASVHFTLNASDTSILDKPSVIARNLVILWLITHTQCPTFVIAEIWFSLRLSQLTYAYLLDAVFAFTCGNIHSLLSDMGVIEIDEALLRAVLSLMDEWVQWHSKLSVWDTIMDMRDDWLSRMLNESRRHDEPCVETLSQHVEELSDSLIFMYHLKGEATLPKEQVHNEISEYLLSGCLKQEPKYPQLYTNPTLFQHPSKYNVNVVLIPYTCAPAFYPRYDRTSPLHSLLHSSLKSWIHCLRSRSRSKSRVTWSMHMMTTERTPAFCMNLTRRHDFAFVANTCEANGLLPILQSLQGIVEHSVLMCTSDIPKGHDRSRDKYLQRHLFNTPPEMIPSLLAWRCLGCDGNEWKTIFPGTDRRDPVQYMLWVPCSSDENELSLDLARSKTFEVLFRSVRKKLLTRNNAGRQNVGKDRDFLVYDKDEEYASPISYSAIYTHPFVFLPLFVRSWSSQGDLSALQYLPDDEFNAEFRDVLKFLVEDQSKDGMEESCDLRLASLVLPRDWFRKWGKVKLSETDGSSSRDVYSIHVNGIPYYGLNIVEGVEDVTFSWLLNRRRLHGAEQVQVMYGVKRVIKKVTVQAVRCASVSRSELNAWIFDRLPRACTSSAAVGFGYGLSVTRVERQNDMELAIRNESAHAMNVDIETGGKCSGIQVSFKDGEKVHKQVFSVPYKLCKKQTTKVLDGTNGYEAIVSIAKSGLELTTPSIVKGAQTESMWFHDMKIPDAYLSWILPQTLSPEESVVGMLNRALWSKQTFCKSVIYSMLTGSSEVEHGTLVLHVDEHNTPFSQRRPGTGSSKNPLFEGASKRQLLKMEIASKPGVKSQLWRHELTGAMGLKIKWVFYPRMIDEREVCRQEGLELPPCISRDEMKTLVAVLESRAVGEVKKRKGHHDFLVNNPEVEFISPVSPDFSEILQMSEKLSQLESGLLPRDRAQKIEEEMLLVHGCKIGTSILAVECWDGQADLLAPGRVTSTGADDDEREIRKREFPELSFSVNETRWVRDMTCWFKKAQRHGMVDKAQLEMRMASLDMGITHGLQFVDPTVLVSMQTSDPATCSSDNESLRKGLWVVVQCLVQAAQCREALGKQDLIVPYLNKALHLIERGHHDKVLSPNDNEIFQLESTAQRLLAKAVDRPSR